ncbi:MAG: hypothetical protein HY255_12015 [Betaproteobacteria bacterium]|nr:hypothetical protein [Betaproteobacteria bacterium]
MIPTLFVVSGVILALNVIATTSVSRCDSFDKRQKTIQFFLIWLVPVFGGWMAWALSSEERRRPNVSQLEDRIGSDNGAFLDTGSAPAHLGGSEIEGDSH